MKEKHPTKETILIHVIKDAKLEKRLNPNSDTDWKVFSSYKCECVYLKRFWEITIDTTYSLSRLGSEGITCGKK